MKSSTTNREAAALAGEHVSFSFGENWRKFLASVDEGRIRHAERSLTEFLGADRLDGLRFLDIGSGSGLFSMAAHRLGAGVVSIDVDPESVACTNELRRRAGSPGSWIVVRGSILDSAVVESLPASDVVYSWGVLHHTGALGNALENAVGRMAPGGVAYIALYNRTAMSGPWLQVKRLYNRSPKLGKRALFSAFAVLAWCQMSVRRTWPPRVIREYASTSRRGMHWSRDLEDWLGGLPYEYMSVTEMQGWAEARGFEVARCRPDPSIGCNEFLLRQRSSPTPAVGLAGA